MEGLPVVKSLSVEVKWRRNRLARNVRQGRGWKHVSSVTLPDGNRNLIHCLVPGNCQLQFQASLGYIRPCHISVSPMSTKRND